MASTRFGKPCGASLAALLLVVAVLAGSFAPGAQAQIVQLTAENKLDNDCNYTITAPELPGSGKSFFVPARESTTVTIEATQSLSSPKFIIKVLGWPPLGGRSYETNGSSIARVVSLTGLKVVDDGPCGNISTCSLQIEVYTMPLLVPGLNEKVFSQCVQPQNN